LSTPTFRKNSTRVISESQSGGGLCKLVSPNDHGGSQVVSLSGSVSRLYKSCVIWLIIHDIIYLESLTSLLHAPVTSVMLDIIKEKWAKVWSNFIPIQI